MLVHTDLPATPKFTFDATFVHLLAQLLSLVCGLTLVAYGAVTNQIEVTQIGGAAIAASSLIAWRP